MIIFDGGGDFLLMRHVGLEPVSHSPVWGHVFKTCSPQKVKDVETMKIESSSQKSVHDTAIGRAPHTYRYNTNNNKPTKWILFGLDVSAFNVFARRKSELLKIWVSDVLPKNRNVDLNLYLISDCLFVHL